MTQRQIFHPAALAVILGLFIPAGPAGAQVIDLHPPALEFITVTPPPETRDAVRIPGAFQEVRPLQYCDFCPKRDRFDEDLTQFLLLTMVANRVYRPKTDGFWKPETTLWKENVSRFRFYDGDRWQTDTFLHPVVATATYLTLRDRGYSRAGAAFFLMTSLTAREFAVKAWGDRVSMDDAFIFTASGLLFGTIIEKVPPLRRHLMPHRHGDEKPGDLRWDWSPTRVSVQW